MLDAKIAEALHEQLAKQLLARLCEDTCDTCGRSAASATLLTVIRQFLSDNDVNKTIRPPPEKEKVKELPFRDPEV